MKPVSWKSQTGALGEIAWRYEANRQSEDCSRFCSHDDDIAPMPFQMDWAVDYRL
jgi:hypothetical protein